jgi:hypothetical protein
VRRSIRAPSHDPKLIRGTALVVKRLGIRVWFDDSFAPFGEPDRRPSRLSEGRQPVLLSHILICKRMIKHRLYYAINDIACRRIRTAGLCHVTGRILLANHLSRIEEEKTGKLPSPKLYRYGQGSIFSAQILEQL